MNRKIGAFALALALCCTLCACGGQTKAPGGTSFPAAPSAGSAAVSADAATSATREAEASGQAGIIKMTVEGQTEEVPATLYTGDGWSIYIPDQGWRVDPDPEDHEVAWESTDNEDVELSVRFWPEKGDLDSLFAAAQAAEDDFAFTVDDNTLTGTDQKDGETMIVYPSLMQGTQDAYTISIRYPDEAAEGFGVRLQAMAATFSTVRAQGEK